ncbi:glycosyltransferase family 4 protein [Photobacterium gaetbulicola]|uniref:glycosyltransferase family 4 protein n=1 Tax=Photobacterium gaetbulicola TaxID=1295392 RepID=UPI000689FB16|nr:glycosyltransferase family 4 protein [Photobacterium gaetbulicola]
MDNNKIAIIEPVGGHGGMNYYDLGLSEGVSKSGIKVNLYTSYETKAHSTEMVSIFRYFRGVWTSKHKIFKFIFFILGLLSSLFHAKCSKIKVIHYHFFNYGFLQYLMVIAGKLFLFKIVITTHDVESFSGKDDESRVKKILGFSDAIIVHNLVSKERLLAKDIISESLVHVIPHGNYINQIENKLPQKQALELLSLKQKKVILFFGQIKNVKGLDVLLNATPKIIGENEDLLVLIAGKVWKDEWSKYQQIINDLNINTNVVSHIKYIPDEDVKLYFSAAKLIVLPYKEIYQSGVLLKSMSYKVPVLTSNIPGMTEIVSDHINGYTFEVNDSTSLANKVNDIINDDDRLANVANNAYDLMEKNYSWDAIGKLTSVVYKSCLPK